MHLILGEDAFLGERQRHQIIRQLREQAPDLEVLLFRPAELTPADIARATSPSLFGDQRAVVITGAEQAGADAAEMIFSAAKEPAAGITVVVHHSGKGRSKQLVTKLRKLPGTAVHEIVAPRRHELGEWVRAEFAAHSRRVAPDVALAILESVGSDLRELASAVGQLSADTEGEITAEVVHRYYQGVAEVSGFDIADLACTGQLPKAVASTRRALQLGMSPVALATALSMQVSAIARLYSVRGGTDKFALGAAAGLPPWKAEQTLRVARRWDGAAVSEAVMLMAQLDAAVKGQTEGDMDYALEAAVRRIAELAR